MMVPALELTNEMPTSVLGLDEVQMAQIRRIELNLFRMRLDFLEQKSQKKDIIEQKEEADTASSVAESQATALRD